MDPFWIPILICAVMPIAIVGIIFGASAAETRQRTKVLITAIESNQADADKIAELFQKQKKSQREVLNKRLLRGCIYSLIGVVLIIVAIIKLCFGESMADEEVSFPLLGGGISMAIGVSYVIVYYVTRKEIKD